MKSTMWFGVIVLALVLIAGSWWYVRMPGNSLPRGIGGTDQASSTDSGAHAAPPHIESLSPGSGAPGTTVTIKGSGFSSGDNLISFGDSTGRHHPDGSPDNVVAHASSADGTTLTFEVPRSGPSGILCDEENHCIGVSAILLSAGQYTVAVINENGASNGMVFTLSR